MRKIIETLHDIVSAYTNGKELEDFFKEKKMIPVESPPVEIRKKPVPKLDRPPPIPPKPRNPPPPQNPVQPLTETQYRNTLDFLDRWEKCNNSLCRHQLRAETGTYVYKDGWVHTVKKYDEKHAQAP